MRGEIIAWVVILDRRKFFSSAFSVKRGDPYSNPCILELAANFNCNNVSHIISSGCPRKELATGKVKVSGVTHEIVEVVYNAL